MWHLLIITLGRHKKRFYTQDECQPLSKARGQMLPVKFQDRVDTQILLGVIVPDNPLHCLPWVRKKKKEKKKAPILLYCLALNLLVGVLIRHLRFTTIWPVLPQYSLLKHFLLLCFASRSATHREHQQHGHKWKDIPPCSNVQYPAEIGCKMKLY